MLANMLANMKKSGITGSGLSLEVTFLGGLWGSFWRFGHNLRINGDTDHKKSFSSPRGRAAAGGGGEPLVSVQ